MAKIEIKVNGKAYPCRLTMGAMLRFKQETDKEVDEIGGSISLTCAFLYCCVVSACKCDGVEFDMSLMEFADHVSPADLNSWQNQIQDVEETAETQGEEKKS